MQAHVVGRAAQEFTMLLCMMQSHLGEFHLLLKQ